MGLGGARLGLMLQPPCPHQCGEEESLAPVGSIALKHLPGSASVCRASPLIAGDRAVLHKPALSSPGEVTDVPSLGSTKPCNLIREGGTASPSAICKAHMCPEFPPPSLELLKVPFTGVTFYFSPHS